MGRLDCKVPSILALAELSRSADAFMTISEEEAGAAMGALADNALATTPSGGAGLAGLLACDGHARERLGLDASSRVLAYLSEAAQ